MKKYYIQFFVSLLIIFCFKSNAISQSKDNNDWSLPTLNGNKFIINSVIPSPFIKSSIKSTLGFASSLETKIPFSGLDTILNPSGINSGSLDLKADIGIATGEFQFSFAIKDWASIWLELSGVGRFGTNTQTILFSGITANSAFETGMLFKVFESKKSIISTSIRINNSNSTVVNLYQFINAILDSTINIENNALTKNYNPLTGAIDVRFGYAPSPKWSIMAYVDGGYGEVIDVDTIENKFSYAFGASVNYDLGITTSIPFGFGAAFKLDSNTPTRQYFKNPTQAYMLQIIYTGSKDFTIDLESNYVAVPTRLDDVTLNLSSFSLGWAYYFK